MIGYDAFATPFNPIWDWDNLPAIPASVIYQEIDIFGKPPVKPLMVSINNNILYKEEEFKDNSKK
jgi:hypothetical protein